MAGCSKKTFRVSLLLNLKLSPQSLNYIFALEYIYNRNAHWYRYLQILKTIPRIRALSKSPQKLAYLLVIDKFPKLPIAA